jgi:hypothetical protein
VYAASLTYAGWENLLVFVVLLAVTFPVYVVLSLVYLIKFEEKNPRRYIALGVAQMYFGLVYLIFFLCGEWVFDPGYAFAPIAIVIIVFALLLKHRTVMRFIKKNLYVSKKDTRQTKLAYALAVPATLLGSVIYRSFGEVVFFFLYSLGTTWFVFYLFCAYTHLLKYYYINKYDIDIASIDEKPRKLQEP